MKQIKYRAVRSGGVLSISVGNSPSLSLWICDDLCESALCGEYLVRCANWVRPFLMKINMLQEVEVGGGREKNNWL